MEDHVSLISVGPASDKFHYVIGGKVMNTKSAMLHLTNAGMDSDSAEDHLATLPEKWFADMDAFLAEESVAN